MRRDVTSDLPPAFWDWMAGPDPRETICGGLFLWPPMDFDDWVEAWLEEQAAELKCSRERELRGERGGREPY